MIDVHPMVRYQDSLPFFRCSPVHREVARRAKRVSG